jgi:hypothetical protein
MTQQAVDIAAQQMAIGVPADQASQIAANAVVDAAVSASPTTTQMNVEGDPKAGPYYVAWLAGPYNQPWVHYFATVSERDNYASFLPSISTASFMISNISTGGPNVNPSVSSSAVMVPAGTPTTPYFDPNPPHIEGDPKAGPYYVRWEIRYGFPSLKAGTKEVWIHYFATVAERNAFFNSPLRSIGSGAAMPDNYSKGGPDVKSADFVPGSYAVAPSSSTESALMRQATAIAAQLISAGVPADQAAQNAASAVVDAAVGISSSATSPSPTGVTTAPVAPAPQVAPPPPHPALVSPLPKKAFPRDITLWNRMYPMRRYDR